MCLKLKARMWRERGPKFGYILHNYSDNTMWQIDLTGSLLQTIYQIRSLPKLFRNGVYFYMHSVTCVGDTAKSSLALATYQLTWRVFRQLHWRNNCWSQKSEVEQQWSRYHGWRNNSRGSLASMVGDSTFF